MMRVLLFLFITFFSVSGFGTRGILSLKPRHHGVLVVRGDEAPRSFRPTSLAMLAPSDVLVSPSLAPPLIPSDMLVAMAEVDASLGEQAVFLFQRLALIVIVVSAVKEIPKALRAAQQGPQEPQEPQE